ncbi:MAG: hypothetical protein MMC33_008413 [Icmadophila ericetorum]|nr:hypothetical protein [Icmadophila ericetorum]
MSTPTHLPKRKVEVEYSISDLLRLLHPRKYNSDPLLALLYPPGSDQKPDSLTAILQQTMYSISASGINITIPGSLRFMPHATGSPWSSRREGEKFLGAALWAKYTPQSRNLVANIDMFNALINKGGLQLDIYAIVKGGLKDLLGSGLSCYLLLRLYVEPAFRGKGSGKNIIRDWFQEADNEGIPILTYSPTNGRLSAFFTNLGFSVVKTYPLNLKNYGGEGIYELAIMRRMPGGVPVVKGSLKKGVLGSLCDPKARECKNSAESRGPKEGGVTEKRPAKEEKPEKEGEAVGGRGRKAKTFEEGLEDGEIREALPARKKEEKGGGGAGQCAKVDSSGEWGSG